MAADASASAATAMAVDDVAAPAVGMEDQAALPENSTTTGDQTPWAASYRIAQLERQLEEEEKRRRHADTCLDERTAELERLETAAALAKTQLAQAREHIFGLQSPRADITDTEAAEAFGALYAGIERWVQNRLDPVLGALFDGRLAELRQPDAVAAGPLLALVREPARGWTKAAQSDEPHAMAAIWEFLRANIFARSFYCPLTDFPGVDMAVLFIDEIVENMAGNLHRDMARCRDWRSEALAAVTSDAKFVARREQYVATLSTQLSAAVGVLVPDTAPDELAESIRSTIIGPAIDLAHRLHLAARPYSIRWLDDDNEATEVDIELLALADGDVRAWNPAVKTTPLAMFAVSPGLFVQDFVGAHTAPRRVLYKSRLLTHDSAHEPKRADTVISWLMPGE